MKNTRAILLIFVALVIGGSILANANMEIVSFILFVVFILMWINSTLK